MRRVTSLCALALALPAHAQSLPTNPFVPLAAALEAAESARKVCLARGWPVAVTVVDRAGLVIVQLRDPAAGAQSADGATRKARTSAGFHLPTSKLVEHARAHPEIIALNNLPDVLLLGGGVPITVGGATVGGIGVAGAPDNALDETCARTGAELIAAKYAGRP